MTKKEEQKTEKVLAKIAKLFKEANLSEQDEMTLLANAILNASKKDSNGKFQICSKKGR